MPDITKEEAISILLAKDEKDETTHIASNSSEYTFQDAVSDFLGSSQGWISDSAGMEHAAINAIATLYGKGSLYTPARILRMIRDISEAVDNPSTPWLGGALDKRYSFVFHESVRIEGDTSKLDKIRAIPGNQNFLKPVWNEQFSRQKDTEGNVYIIENLKTGRIFILPFEQIQDIYVHDDDNGYTTFIKRNPSANSYLNSIANNNDKDCYIIPRYNNDISDYQFRKSTKETAHINHNMRFWDFHTAKKLTEPLARPPLLLATLYCSAAARDLADTSRYKHSSSLVAMKAVSTTQAGAKKGVEEVARIQQAGSIAGMTSDYVLSGVTSQGMNITNNGFLGYLSAAAASVNIPVTQFAMTVAGNSGAQASTTTLSESMDSYYASQTNIVVDFFQEILGEDIEISFVSNSADSVAKNVASATTVYQNHGLFQEEYRNFAIDQLNIENPKDGLPEIPDISIPTNGSNTPSALSRDSGRDNDVDSEGTER